jgi:hypothetical protein
MDKKDFILIFILVFLILGFLSFLFLEILINDIIAVKYHKCSFDEIMRNESVFNVDDVGGTKYYCSSLKSKSLNSS